MFSLDYLLILTVSVVAVLWVIYRVAFKEGEDDGEGGIPHPHSSPDPHAPIPEARDKVMA